MIKNYAKNEYKSKASSDFQSTRDLDKIYLLMTSKTNKPVKVDDHHLQIQKRTLTDIPERNNVNFVRWAFIRSFSILFGNRN